MKLMTMTLTSALSLSVLAQGPHQTIAASALKSLKENREKVSMGMPISVDDGSDVAYVCLALQYSKWGNLVYNSIVKNPKAVDPAQVKNYLNNIDNIQLSFSLIEGKREGLIAIVGDTYEEFQASHQYPIVPENLTFNTFSSEEKKYLDSLNSCGNPDFLEAAMAKLDSVDLETKFSGADVVTPARKVVIEGAVISNSSGGITVGNICTGDCKPSVVIEITSKDSIFNKSKSYESWIETFTQL